MLGWRLLVAFIWLMYLVDFLRKRQLVKLLRPFRYAHEAPLQLRANPALLWFTVVTALMFPIGFYPIIRRLLPVDAFLAVTMIPPFCIWPLLTLVRSCALLRRTKSARKEWEVIHPKSFDQLTEQLFGEEDSPPDSQIHRRNAVTRSTS